MSFSYTSKFVQLTSYLLMEYRYADQPNPETHFTNTGTDTVGFDKLVNGFMDNSVQIFNPVSDLAITNNTTNTSVVKVSDTSFITLDGNLIVPFNDFDDKLTNSVDLPITFPSNLSVVYDSVRYHIRAGYNLSNLDGLIAAIQFPDQNGKYVTMSQILIKKGTNQEYEFSPSPISIGAAIYDKYLEVKIPNLKDMNDKYLAASDFFKPSTLAGLISQSGTGFIYGAPLRISLFEVQNIDTYSGYDRYNTVSLAILSLEQEDPFSNIGSTIKESDQGQFFEYYATDNEGFIEDFILFQNSIGNSYFISHQIQVIEQIGASFIETSRFETIQTTAYDVPNYYRPIVRNSGVAASFTLRYTMSLVNNKDQSRVTRIGTYTSSNPSEWGISITPIKLSNFPQVQKIYNRVYGQGTLDSSSKISKVKVLDRIKYVNTLVQQNYVTTVFSNLTIPNQSKSTTGSSDITVLGSGKLTIQVSPFDNFYKFKFIKTGSDGSPVDIDLTSFGILRISFIQEKGEKLNIKSFSDNTLANPGKGEVIFKIDESNSTRILNLTDKRFFITTGTEDPNVSQTSSPQQISSSSSSKISLASGIKSKIVEKANVLNKIKEFVQNEKINSSVLYWGYWKPAGGEDVVVTSTSSTTGIGLSSIPVIQRPIDILSKTPIITALNSITPASTPSDSSSDPSLTLTRKDAIISAIKIIMSPPVKTAINFADMIAATGAKLVELRLQYPTVSKTDFLSYYDSAISNQNLAKTILKTYLEDQLN